VTKEHDVEEADNDPHVNAVEPAPCNVSYVRGPEEARTTTHTFPFTTRLSYGWFRWPGMAQYAVTHVLFSARPAWRFSTASSCRMLTISVRPCCKSPSMESVMNCNLRSAANACILSGLGDTVVKAFLSPAPYVQSSRMVSTFLYCARVWERGREGIRFGSPEGKGFVGLKGLGFRAWWFEAASRNYIFAKRRKSISWPKSKVHPSPPPTVLAWNLGNTTHLFDRVCKVLPNLI